MVRPLLAIVVLAACARTMPERPSVPASDGGLTALIRSLVADSLAGGGMRADQVLAPVDSSTAELLRRAGLTAATAHRATHLLCPGSTSVDAQPTPPPTGYWVRMTLTPGADSTLRQIHVSKRCRYRFRGRDQGFRESGTWELRLDGDRWRIARVLDRSIT